MFQTTFRILLMAAFAVWFGGFTFYTSIVVPVGTDILGSSRTQGFVTQQVTHWMNVVGGVTLFILICDVILWRKSRTRRTCLALIMVVALLTVSWVILLILHPMLDAMLEPEHEYVTDEGRFYQLHRAYLWTSTIQWLLCWIWMVLVIKDWRLTPSTADSR